MFNLLKVRAEISQKFANADIKTACLDARLLIQFVLGINHEEYVLANNRGLTLNEMAKIEALVERRLNREPVAKIIGYKEFWGRDFKTSKDTLDPRPDSETLIECILDGTSGGLSILDLGTGTGCLLLTLLSEIEGATGVAVDMSELALKVAQENADNLDLSSRVKFIKTNWFENIDDKFDIIISNPPYIPTRDIKSLELEVKEYDPMSALDGGVDGLDDYRKIIAQAKNYLKENGKIFFEIGQGQEIDIIPMLQSEGFQNIQTVKDLSGITRCIFAISQ